MRKKGFQLSVNFLVVIILSIVLFGVGMTVFYQVVDIGTKVHKDIDEHTQAQLDRAMDDGGVVVIPRKVVDVTAGDVAYVPFGFINEGNPANFGLHVSADEENPSSIPEDDIVYYDTFEDVGRNQRAYGQAGIRTMKNTPVGQYGFSLNVKRYGNLYGGNHKFYVYIN